MMLISLQDYANSETSAPQRLGDVVSDYGKQQLWSIAALNGLTQHIADTQYKAAVDTSPEDIDRMTATAMLYINDCLVKAGGCEAYLTETGEFYAIRSNLDYGYLDSDGGDSVWNELQSYGEGN